MSLILDLQHDGPVLDFSAEIPTGAITALVGPSGSGKTSVLRAIAGLLRLRRERVSFAGQDWSDSRHRLYVPTRLRPIGLVPQQYGLFPHMTVQGNVEIALTHLAAAERRVRAARCLELAHIASFERRYPHQLSGGQKQRVAFARAIARQPQLLLLDEPLDRSTRKRLLLTLHRLREEFRTTVVLVTHDLDEAAQLASHLILLRDGRPLQAGPTAQVLTRPCCEEAAQLLDIQNVFDALAEPTPSGNAAFLRWGLHTLRIAEALPPGANGALKFAVLPQNVLLVRSDKPWNSHLENPVPAVVEEVVGLGSEAIVWRRPEGVSGALLQMRLPDRAVRRYALAAGKAVTVCLRAADLIALTPAPSEQ